MSYFIQSFLNPESSGMLFDLLFFLAVIIACVFSNWPKNGDKS